MTNPGGSGELRRAALLVSLTLLSTVGLGEERATSPIEPAPGGRGGPGAHWAFVPPQSQALPAVADPGWARRPLDRFVLARLEEDGLAPEPAADRRTWIRRVALSLTGLPPRPADVEAFLADGSTLAHERVVDALLASPGYGERWARLWLDLARYAEDQAHIVGDNRSLFYPNAHLYRDWVIEALNADMPYDEFVRQQLAADFLAPDDNRALAALGFLGLGPKYYGRGSIAVKADEWADRVDVVTRGLLGLTVACARCHDHKVDPVTTADYYALAGVFASTRMFNRPLDDDRQKKGDGEAKSPADAVHIVRDGNPTDLNVFLRGNVEARGPVARRRFIEVLVEGEPEPFLRGSGRQELAECIVDRRNPLTARVLVNRIWGAHFGRPLVTTPSNFGVLGDRPTHPRLLDDLAVRFMDSGWSLKWLHREIVLSATYRQRSVATPEKIARDPENTWLARGPRRRMSVETWRDTILAVSGRLDLRLGGPSVAVDDPEVRRRTVYAEVSRLDLNPMLALFDFPDPNVHAASRAETTTPLQKLFVMNSPFMIAHARALARRLREEAAGESEADVEPRIRRGYALAFGRNPTPRELELAREFISGRGATAAADTGGATRWVEYAQVLLAANELLFID